LRYTLDKKQYRSATAARTWSEAETAKRDLLDALSGKPKAAEGPKLVSEAVRAFLQSKAEITKPCQTAYVRLLNRLQAYAVRQGVLTVPGLTQELLAGYCSTWPALYPASGSRIKVAKLLRCFLRYCVQSEWATRIPALPKIKVDTRPTLPLTDEEYTRLLAASPRRVRAMIQLMRHSGLSVRDACTLKRSAIAQTGVFWRVTTSRQKTGARVSVPVPRAIAEEILAVQGGDADHVFWHGRGEPAYYASNRGADIKDAFARAGIVDVCRMKSHRLRDSFAVGLLQRGVPLEEVSKLLGHTSVVTTEKFYAPWVKARQDRLDALVIATWSV
jgi:integrase